MFHLVGTRSGHPVGTGSCHGVKEKISESGTRALVPK